MAELTLNIDEKQSPLFLQNTPLSTEMDFFLIMILCKADNCKYVEMFIFQPESLCYSRHFESRISVTISMVAHTIL